MNILKRTLLQALALAAVLHAQANTEPTVIINSAAMRDGTTLMDVSYRVNDPDDATVKTRALAFVDGVRSFENVLRPETFAEGTDSNLGDTIATNTDHTLTWDVGADWDVDLAQVKFEVLAQDDRGLFEFDWITIPAAGGEPELTVSQNSPAEDEILDALFWLYAANEGLFNLQDGELKGSSTSGIFKDLILAEDAEPQAAAAPFTYKQLNFEPATGDDMALAQRARAQVTDFADWHATRRPYSTTQFLYYWSEYEDLPEPPTHTSSIVSMVTGFGWSSPYILALLNDGSLLHSGYFTPVTSNKHLATSGMEEHDKIIDLAGGSYHAVVLRSDGTVAEWGGRNYEHRYVPEGLSSVVAIAAAGLHTLALKSDGTVIAWGVSNNSGFEVGVPEGLTDVQAIATSSYHSLALKDDGTVVAWGGLSYQNSPECDVPQGLTDVIKIAAFPYSSIALKSDGTVVSWGQAPYAAPDGLSDVIDIKAAGNNAIALKSDGAVVSWGIAHASREVPEGLPQCISVWPSSHAFFVMVEAD